MVPNWLIRILMDILYIGFIDIGLSIDNIAVIAAVVEGLPQRNRLVARLVGQTAAVVGRVVLTVFASNLVAVPIWHPIGSGLLLLIGYRLMMPEKEKEDRQPDRRDNRGWLSKVLQFFTERVDNPLVACLVLFSTDIVLSLDNVIALTAVTTNFWLLLVGVGLAVVVMFFGSSVLSRMMQRWPITKDASALLIMGMGVRMAVESSILLGGGAVVIALLLLALDCVEWGLLSRLKETWQELRAFISKLLTILKR